MGELRIVGLGPGGDEHLTLAARDTLAAAPEVWLRTRRHPGAENLPTSAPVHSFDDLYETLPTFEAVYTTIAERVLVLAARPQGVVYAVPGHPLVGEATVQRLLAAARERGLAVRIVAGLSFLEPVCAALGLDPVAANLQLVDAAAVADRGPWTVDRGPWSADERPGRAAGGQALADGGPRSTVHGPRSPEALEWFPNVGPELFDPERPVLLCQLYDRRQAGLVKLALLERYPAEHPVTLVGWAGVAGRERAETLPLYELDRRDGVDHLTCVYVPALAPLDDHTSFAGLRYIVARLRAPGGCPWDRKQTHQSLKPYLIEEAYEAVTALDEGDLAAFAEELGDVLLLVLMQAQIATEAGDFTLPDVFRSITTKLIRRHPHVFGDVEVRGAEDVLRNWEQIKQAEKGTAEAPASLLAKLPSAMPALGMAQEQQKRAATVGFVWPDAAAARAKLAEELAELDAAPPADRLHELGDVLAAVTALAQQWGLDAEEALRLANHRFRARFQRVEALARARGLNLPDLTTEQKLALWAEAKGA